MSKREYLMGCPLCGADAREAKLECKSCFQPLTQEIVDRMVQMEMMTRLDDQVRCTACLHTFPAYLLDEKTFDQLARVKLRLIEQNDGRNLGCWPLGSFGGKDADLEPGGCTGIKALIGVDGDKLIFVVGGHKTVSDGSCLEVEDENIVEHYNTMAQELVCGCGFDGEWTGDEWVVSYSDKIAVPVVNYQDLARGSDIDPGATAYAVIKEALTRTEAFEASMQELSQQLDALYEECMEEQG